MQTEVGTFPPYVTVPVNTGSVTACVLDFTNAAGSPVAIYAENGTATVQVNDADQNTLPLVVETITAFVQNPSTGDYETLTLTEISANSQYFRGSLPTASGSGQAPEDGTLYARAGDTIQASYTDTLFGDSCSDTAQIVAPSNTKPLYLSDPNQALDRVDPVATGDTTTLSTTVLGGSSGTGDITVVGLRLNTTRRQSEFVIISLHSGSTGTDRLLIVGISLEEDNDSSFCQSPMAARQ